MIEIQTLSLADLESYDAGANRSGSERRFLCPFCGAGKPRDNEHRSFAVNTDTGAYICHRCREKGLIKEKWSKSDLSPRRARTSMALARVFAVGPMPSPALEQKKALQGHCKQSQTKIERLQTKMKAFQKAFDLSPALAYLQTRGITEETAKAFGCGYAAAWEHWEKDQAGNWQLLGTDRRVVFPVTNRQGEVVAFHGRAIDDFYIGSPKISKGDKSLGLFQTPDALESDVVAIVEGPVDAMALFQCGMTAVALIGTSAGDWLQSALAFSRVFAGTDADDAGDESAQTLIADFRSRGARAVRLRPVDCNDWAEFLETRGAKALQDILAQATIKAFAPYHSKTELVNGNLNVEDDFSVDSESAQKAIDWLLADAKKYEEREPNNLLLIMPTYHAYETESALLAGITQHSQGRLDDTILRSLIEKFMSAHLLSNNVSLPWTGNEVELFHLTLWVEGRLVDNLTCNRFQSWIISQLWIRSYASQKIEIKAAKL
jgi:5S rRNA maturation endonuclease (ribonuclease M5)